jgi:hypothetical protein
MTKKDKEKKGKTSDTDVTFTYERLGTITLDEQKQAIWEDIQALRDEFGVAYITGAELIIRATNEFGDPLKVRRLSNGAVVHRLDTHHYHPAWGRLKDATRGVGARRERTRPEQFLQLEFSMPSLPDQKRAIELFRSVDVVRGLQKEITPELAAMLPAILDKAFKGEL